MSNRRSFVKNTLGVLAVASLPGAELKAAPKSPYIPKLGVAGYSFVNFNLDDSLKMMKRLDIKYLCIKDFHLPFKSTDQQIQDFHKKLADYGVKGYAVGPIYVNKSRKDIDDAFDYAKRVGVDLIVGIPKIEDLAYVSQKTDEYGIRFAIHNHGPQDKLYPNATVVYNYVKNLSSRLGLCFDMGHNSRDGQDSVKDLKRYANRIFDMHFKDITEPTNEGVTTELGKGIMDIPKFMKTLKEINYQGVCSLEHEKDMKDPLAGIAESKGYFYGVIDSLLK